MFLSIKLSCAFLMVAMAGAAGFQMMEDPPMGGGGVLALWAFDADGPTAGSDWAADKPIKAKGTKVKNEAGRLQVFSIDGGSKTLQKTTYINGAYVSRETWKQSPTPPNNLWPTTQAQHPYRLELRSKNPDGSYKFQKECEITVTYTP